jgi:hypothetical protein
MDSYAEDFDEPPTYENLKLVMDYCTNNVPGNVDIVHYLTEKLKSFVNRKKIREQQILLNQQSGDKHETFEHILKSLKKFQ